jgi:hypothetical protein
MKRRIALYAVLRPCCDPRGAGLAQIGERPRVLP